MRLKWCKKFNIADTDLRENKLDPINSCTNGLILELYGLAQQRHLSDLKFASWLQLLLPNSIPTDLSNQTIREIIRTKLYDKKKVLSGKRKDTEVKEYENLTFVFSDICPKERICESRLNELPRTPLVRCQTKKQMPNVEKEAAHVVCDREQERQRRIENRQSTSKENELTHQVQKKRKHLDKLQNKIRTARAFNKWLNDRAGIYKPKNVKRRERRHISSLNKNVSTNKQLEEKLQDCQSKCQALSSKVKLLEKKVIDEQRLKSYYKRRWEKSNGDQLEIKKLKDNIKVLQEEVRYLQSQECDTCSSEKTKHVNLKSGGVYSEHLRMCCMFLSALEVASHRVGEVIKVVAHFIFDCELLLSQLPGRGTVQSIIDEGQFLMKKYYEERLQACHHYGVKKDGTTRQKRKILGSCFRLDTGEVLPCTFKQVASETGETISNNVQEELCEVSQCGQELEHDSPTDNVDKNILQKMTYTMSDRAANEKASNRCLDEWRTGLVEGAEPMYHLHCMAHPLLGFHAYILDDLKKLQREYENAGFIFGRDKESHYRIFGKQYVAARLPLHVCAIVGPVGDDRNGIQDKWERHCKKNGIKSVIPNYQDNRFNALFEASAAVVHHRAELISCITTAREAGNKNMKVYSVLLDLQDDRVMAIICALGLTYCQITKPYWNMVTSEKVEYMHLYRYVQKLHGCLLEWNENPTALLENDHSVFTDFPVSEQDQLQSCKAANVDQVMLEKNIVSVTTGLVRCCEKQLADFLGDGKFASEPTSKDLRLTSHSGNTTLESERQFGSLDASMSRRRNASLHYHSSLLMLKTNKKQFFEWLEKKEDTQMWKKARQFGKKLRATHHAQEEREKNKIHDNTIQAVKKKKASQLKKAAKRLPACQSNKRKAGTPPKEKKRQHTEVPSQLQPCLDNGLWVAVAYESGWYPGHIIGQDGDLVTVDFLQPARGDIFKKPEKEDIVNVEREFIFANVEKPVSLGRRSRYKVQHCDELEEQYGQFKERNW